MTRTKLKAHLLDGQVIPAAPLLLDSAGKWSEKHQRAVTRYFLESGAGGLAVGVHSTQFEIREPQHALFKPVLTLTSEEIDRAYGPERTNFVKVAGLCGQTKQALEEAAVAIGAGYDAGLLSLSAWKGASEESILTHCAEVAKTIPLIGFYLQPAVGGRVLSYSFWRRLAEIENLVAIKIAPFNRYQTLDVVRAIIMAGRSDVALYTGNDDNIIVDLLTPFSFRDENGTTQARYMAGGLLGQWGVWTRQAVILLEELKKSRAGEQIPTEWLRWNVALTDANAAIFDAANGFAGCLPGILEVLRRQGLAPSVRCLDPGQRLSPGQAEEITRVIEAYPDLTDDAFVAKHLDRWLSM